MKRNRGGGFNVGIAGKLGLLSLSILFALERIGAGQGNFRRPLRARHRTIDD